MKDAQGHGSDSRSMASRQTAGNHQAGVLRLGRFRVQGLDTKLAGNSWGTLKRFGNRAVAERVAQHMRTDNRSDLVRVR